ncbi:MAG: hypothetical protein OEW29_02885 [Acidimicrobiia bacterium]|nr:hypothetical protein [Acidimicrobiia bacterium]
MSRLVSWRRPGGERGASLALFALSVAWLVGLTALVVDVGLGRLTRQTLIPATDSAALAAAQDLVEAPGNPTGACATAGSYLAGNAPGATMTDCEVAPSGAGGGRVTITAAENADATFAAADGSASRAVASVSSAAFGPPLTVSKLRPVAFCYDGSSTLSQLVDNPPASPTVVVVRFVPESPTACGGLSTVGNFTTFALENGASVHQIGRWVRNGYQGQVGFDAPTTTGCDSPALCRQRVDALAEIGSAMDSLTHSGSYVAFPLFDFADTTAVHLIGVVRARLTSFRLDGPPEYWHVELKVDPGLITGTCCGAPGIHAGNQVIALCGVDPDAVSGCEPETGS